MDRVLGLSLDSPTDFEEQALRAGDGVDLVRESVRMVLQELIETEAAQVIGAAGYGRTPERTTGRKGTRPKLLTTKGGDVNVAIPELRQGSYFPSILEPRRRIGERCTRW